MSVAPPAPSGAALRFRTRPALAVRCRRRHLRRPPLRVGHLLAEQRVLPQHLRVVALESDQPTSVLRRDDGPGVVQRRDEQIVGPGVVRADRVPSSRFGGDDRAEEVLAPGAVRDVELVVRDEMVEALQEVA